MKNRKLLICFIMLFFIPLFVKSQGGNVGIGYNVGYHLSNKGMNFVLDRYNETRSYLSAKMGKPNVYRGFTFYSDIYFRQAMVDFDVTINRSYCFAEGVDNTKSLVHRDIKFKVTSWAIGYAKKITNKNQKTLGVYMGSDCNMAFLSTFTRKYTVGQDMPEYEKVIWDVNLGITPYLQWVGNRFSTKAYIRLLILKNDYWDLNYKLNQNTFYKDDIEDEQGGLISAGFALRYNFFKNKKQ